jgi:hypothetical protein
MKVTVSEFGDVGKRFTLVGRLDILGSEAIDLPLAVVAGSGTNIVVDLALQLLFLRASESMGNHDSKVVDADSVD